MLLFPRFPPVTSNFIVVLLASSARRRRFFAAEAIVSVQMTLVWLSVEN